MHLVAAHFTVEQRTVFEKASESAHRAGSLGTAR
jgi:hypothetical protein